MSTLAEMNSDHREKCACFHCDNGFTVRINQAYHMQDGTRIIVKMLYKNSQELNKVAWSADCMPVAAFRESYFIIAEAPGLQSNDLLMGCPEDHFLKTMTLELK